MDWMLLAVLVLLAVTRLYKRQEIASLHHWDLAWLCLVAGVAIIAVAQFWSWVCGLIDLRHLGLPARELEILALALALFFWHKAVTVGSRDSTDRA